MRLTTLLDTVNQGGSGPWPPSATLTTDDARFELVLADLMPCRSHDPELWFAERTSDVERAKALCRECPLREGCLAGAIDREEPWGVWGGEVFVAGQIVATKRGRGRPRKDVAPAA